MGVLRILIAFLIGLALMMVLATPSWASSQVWITIDPPSSSPTPGSTFTTVVSISSWGGVVGALDLDICYDPSALHITDFSTPSDSPFYANIVIDTDSYTSGRTRIAGFQVRDQEMWETPISLGSVTWEVVGSPGTVTDVTIEPEAVVDNRWSPVEVLTYGQRISVGDLPPTISEISPSSGRQGEVLDVIISGGELASVLAVSFGDGIVVDGFNADSSSQITANITIDAVAVIGPRDVSVTTAGGTDILAEGFSVEEAEVEPADEPSDSGVPVWVWGAIGAGVIIVGMVATFAIVLMRRRAT